MELGGLEPPTSWVRCLNEIPSVAVGRNLGPAPATSGFSEACFAGFSEACFASRLFHKPSAGSLKPF